jgi:DNA-binding protein YbaB
MNSPETATDTIVDRAKAEDLLANAAQLQVAFRDALLELEGALGGIEIDGNRDLSETSIDELLVEEDSDSGN